MCVEALTAATTHRVDLKPAGNPVRYLRAVRESLSVLALGTPGGYPVFIRRWTRSGALETDRLTRLLCLGEPEAVVAVAASRNLDDELARRAWWCLPTAEVARLMLAHPAVANGSTGPTLGHFLLDHLPFETASRLVIDTVKLLLRSHLLNDQEIGRLRAQAQDHVAWLVGFLSAGPQYLDARPVKPRNGPSHGLLHGRTGPMGTLLARTELCARQALSALCRKRFETGYRHGHRRGHAQCTGRLLQTPAWRGRTAALSALLCSVRLPPSRGCRRRLLRKDGSGSKDRRDRYVSGRPL